MQVRQEALEVDQVTLRQVGDALVFGIYCR